MNQIVKFCQRNGGEKLLTVVEKSPISGWEAFHCVCETKENTNFSQGCEKKIAVLV